MHLRCSAVRDSRRWSWITGHSVSQAVVAVVGVVAEGGGHVAVVVIRLISIVEYRSSPGEATAKERDQGLEMKTQ